MNALRYLAGVVALWVALSGTALASAEGEAGTMGIGAWLFIGFCALIFVAQMVPALMLLGGMVRGLFIGKEKAPSAPFN